MYDFLLSPPVAFLIFLALSLCVSAFSKTISASAKSELDDNKTNPYACGESLEENQAQTDYAQFFPFAFFFTIMHVVVLLIATDPSSLSLLAVAYLAVTVLALLMLFRRPKHGS